ncbi:centromere/kinetochore protein zw10 homolog isoform X2 [Salvia hispanica]|uniref:centromere/kinetochore protein zw10 homolog isoform X2 n=1 Tax=Salvia hispanica TaxID=49212 RepID=UPI002009545E|nr:centromere/kinetochore protein zw10 homolog isoform X2 [Salvia hispanica]
MRWTLTIDVMINTINVRDLLISPESPSSPLSAPDLRLLISRLDSHSLRIKSTVQSYLLSHHSDFSALFSRCSDVVSKSENLAGDVAALCDQPVEADVGRIVKEIVEKRREARGKREIVEFLGVILELDRKLGVVREDVKSGRVVEAAEGLRELKAALGVKGGGDSHTAEEGEPAVYAIFRKQWVDCFEEIQELLLRFMENAVRFDQDANAVYVKYQIDGVNGLELSTLMNAMDVAGVLDYGLAKIADLITKYVFTPVVSCKAIPIVEEGENNQDPGHVKEAVLKMSLSVESEGNKVDGKLMYSNIVQIIDFFSKYLCFNDGSWMRCFGRLTWPRMSDMIISNFLVKVVPDDASKLPEFQQIRKLTIDFETALKELKFISSSNDKDHKLSNFADNVEVHFASRKKAQILARARNMLLQSDFSLPQDYNTRTLGARKEESADSNRVILLFSSEECVVSVSAKELMELVHQTLKDVCLSPPKVALEFYHAARNALVLYEAIIPVKLQSQLDSITQAAVLMHNDCLYLSQEILGLAFQYRPYFPSSVKELAVFIDLAPKFLLLAEEVLQRQVQLVKSNLKQAIDGANGFQNTHKVKQFESAKFCIDQIVFVIEKVHIIWEPLLLPSVYEKSMTMILESVFTRLAKEILLIDDMAAEETLQLQRLIQLLFEHLSSLLEPMLAVDEREKSQEAQKDMDNLISSIRKLRKLAELLDMPLKSITDAWESGELADCNFEASEVQDFIRAIFTDSPLRRECLFRIENTYFG